MLTIYFNVIYYSYFFQLLVKQQMYAQRRPEVSYFKVSVSRCIFLNTDTDYLTSVSRMKVLVFVFNYNKQGLRLCQTQFILPLYLEKETKQDEVALMFQLCFFICFNIKKPNKKTLHFEFGRRP